MLMLRRECGMGKSPGSGKLPWRWFLSATRVRKHLCDSIPIVTEVIELIPTSRICKRRMAEATNEPWIELLRRLRDDKMFVDGAAIVMPLMPFIERSRSTT